MIFGFNDRSLAIEIERDLYHPEAKRAESVAACPVKLGDFI
jgi:hypothetical protein